MRHLVLLLIFSILFAKVHGEEGPGYAPFLQDEPFLQDDNLWNEEVDYDDSTDLFTEDLTANLSNNCFSYDDVDNIFLSDVARVRLRRETCANPDAPPPTLPTDIYDSNSVLNLLSPPPNSPVISGPRKDPDYLDLERLFGLPLPAPKQKDENDDCPADLYGDSRIPVCNLGSFVRDVEMPARELHCTVYNVRICKFNPSSFLTLKLTSTASKFNPCVDESAAWCCAIVESAVSNAPAVISKLTKLA